MNEKVKPNNSKFIITILVTVITVLIMAGNGIALWMLSDMKIDVRDLRLNYHNALSDVQKLTTEVALLNEKVVEQNEQITGLKNEIVILQDKLGSK